MKKKIKIFFALLASLSLASCSVEGANRDLKNSDGNYQINYTDDIFTFHGETIMISNAATDLSATVSGTVYVQQQTFNIETGKYYLTQKNGDIWGTFVKVFTIENGARKYAANSLYIAAIRVGGDYTQSVGGNVSIAGFGGGINMSYHVYNEYHQISSLVVAGYDYCKI